MPYDEIARGEAPFDAAPDPRFFFPSAHGEPLRQGVLAAIAQASGLILLVGGAGSGKSMLLRRINADLRQSGVAAYVACRTDLSFDELIEACCDGIGVLGKGEGGEQRRAALVEAVLVRAEQKTATALLVDGAEQLDAEVLERLIELAKFAKDGRKLLQVVLAFRPELERNPAYAALNSLERGLVFRCHLAPLKRDEIGPFIRHRLAIAGWGGAEVLEDEAASLIAERAKGNPEAILDLCRRGWQIARRSDERRLSRGIVESLLDERPAAKPEPAAATAASPPEQDVLSFPRESGRAGSMKLWLALSAALAAAGGLIVIGLKEAAPAHAPAAPAKSAPPGEMSPLK